MAQLSHNGLTDCCKSGVHIKENISLAALTLVVSIIMGGYHFPKCPWKWMIIKNWRDDFHADSSKPLISKMDFLHKFNMVPLSSWQEFNIMNIATFGAKWQHTFCCQVQSTCDINKSFLPEYSQKASIILSVRAMYRVSPQIGGIRGCQNNNLQSQKWWQTWHNDNSWFSIAYGITLLSADYIPMLRKQPKKT